MTRLRVREPGMATTFQDGGRVGAARWGVPRSGPMDVLSHRLAARLAGVPPERVGAAVALEVGPQPCVLEVDGSLPLAVAGVGGRVILDGHTVATPCVVHARGEVTVTAGAWAYVVPAGDVELPPVLGSRSRHPRSGLGPALEAGTEVVVRRVRGVRSGTRTGPPDPGGPLLVLPAPQTDRFGAAASALVEEAYRTTGDVDRMAQRLDGPSLHCDDGHDLVSDGIVAGTLQVPGDGRPWVLTADHQTTGGYPKVAVLTTVDLARFVRLPVGATVRFAWTDVTTARMRLRTAQEAIEASVEGPVRPLATDLEGSNLVDGVVDGTAL